MSDLLARLQALYRTSGDPAASDFRLTDRGIWHPTPLAVLAAAVPLLGETLLLDARSRPLQILDAGTGDGRLVAALALGLPASLEVRLGGLESDATLAVAARDKLEQIPAGPGARRGARVAEGDYFDPLAYGRIELEPRHLDLVFNYPDGSERRLLHWLAAHGGPETRLVILSPDHDPALGTPPLWRAPVRVAGDAPTNWTLAVFAPASAGQW